LRIRTFESGDELLLPEVSNRSYPNRMALRRSTQEWIWRFLQNPHFDPEGVIIAEEHRKIVGYLVATPVVARLFGRTIPLTIGTNLCVLPEYRRRGTAAAMIEQLLCYAEGKSEILFVYVEKGGSSHDLVVRRFHWKEVGEPRLFAKVPNLLSSIKLPPSVFLNALFSPSASLPYLTKVINNLIRPGSEHCTEKVGLRHVQQMNDDDIADAIEFINESNNDKLGFRSIDEQEYRWRYFTYSNSSRDSVFVSKREGKIDSHIAVSFHVFSSPIFPGFLKVATLNDVCGNLDSTLKLAIDHAKNRKANLALAYVPFGSEPPYVSLGFFETTPFIIMMKPFSAFELDSDISHNWYVHLEDVIGEP
jgi:GNAT superfamily N-acetyltransferase